MSTLTGGDIYHSDPGVKNSRFISAATETLTSLLLSSYKTLPNLEGRLVPDVLCLDTVRTQYPE